MKLRVAARVGCTESEGPYRRYALWVQGCSLGCPGCCNPELFDAAGGLAISIGDLLAEIEEHRARDGIEGITVLGGEPLEQLAGVAALAQGVAARGLGVLLFTGLRLEEARALRGFAELARDVDTLVDGRFDARHPEPPSGRPIVGSTNQRLHHLTDRYADPSLWRGPSRTEVTIDPDGTLTVVGAAPGVRRLLRALGARGN